MVKSHSRMSHSNEKQAIWRHMYQYRGKNQKQKFVKRSCQNIQDMILKYAKAHYVWLKNTHRSGKTEINGRFKKQI
jgi:hypothetical protein